MMRKETGKQKIIIVILAAAGMFAIFLAMVIFKKININQYLVKGYELSGVDVAHYQGTIDWERLQEQGIDFAFIKATEGSGHIDSEFYRNWQEAGKTELLTGAYHFFSFDSPGITQAQLYISTVGDLTGKLVPVVDVEYYADKKANPPESKEVTAQLKAMLTELEEHYQDKPIIYTTYEVYHKYIEDEFDEYPLWIRNVYYPPLFSMGERWKFWQYSDTAVLDGYSGTEKRIDRNVFRGTKEEIGEFILP